MPKKNKGSAPAVSQLSLCTIACAPSMASDARPHSGTRTAVQAHLPAPKLTTACQQEDPAAAAAAAAKKSIAAHADTAVDAAKEGKVGKAAADTAVESTAESTAATKTAAEKADAERQQGPPYWDEWQLLKAFSEPAAACSSKTLEHSETDLSVVLDEVASDSAHAIDEVASHRAELEQIRGCLGISTRSKLPGNFEFPAAQSARGSRSAGTVSPRRIVRDIHSSASCSTGIPEAFFQPVKSKLKDQSHAVTHLTYVLRDNQSWQYLGWMQTGVEGMWENKGALRWKKDHDLHEVSAALLCLARVVSFALSLAFAVSA